MCILALIFARFIITADLFNCNINPSITLCNDFIPAILLYGVTIILITSLITNFPIRSGSPSNPLENLQYSLYAVGVGILTYGLYSLGFIIVSPAIVALVFAVVPLILNPFFTTAATMIDILSTQFGPIAAGFLFFMTGLFSITMM